MSILEFVLILQAIIIGLAITELLTGAARIFRGELGGGWLHAAWLLTVFVLQAQFLWGSWDFYAGQTEWLFISYLLDLSAPVIFYLISATLFPRADIPGSLNQHLLQRRKPIFLLLALVMLIYSVQNWVFAGGGLGTAEDFHRGAFLASCLLLAWTDRILIHRILGVLLLADVIVFALVFTGSIAVPVP